MARVEPPASQSPRDRAGRSRDTSPHSSTRNLSPFLSLSLSLPLSLSSSLHLSLSLRRPLIGGGVHVTPVAAAAAHRSHDGSDQSTTVSSAPSLVDVDRYHHLRSAPTPLQVDLNPCAIVPGAHRSKRGSSSNGFVRVSPTRVGMHRGAHTPACNARHQGWGGSTRIPLARRRSTTRGRAVVVAFAHFGMRCSGQRR
jgi:hypothetical protein